MARTPLARRLMLLVAVLAASRAGLTREQTSNPLRGFLTDAPSPLEYVLERARTHRIILIGEAHWIRHDAEFLQSLVARLPEAGVRTLAIEWLPASEQDRIDGVTTASTWNRAEAMAVFRVSAWPYAEYLEVLKRVWEVNASAGPSGRLRVLALGPPSNWREVLLPRNQTYETFIADRVIRASGSSRDKTLVWLGLHHMFTRYVLPDLPERPGLPVTQLGDRSGNLIWRQFGDTAFSIVLHVPWTCADGAKWGRCLPVEGAIDCAADPIGRPLAFDLNPPAIGDLPVSNRYWYGLGRPRVRLIDLADGYIWTKPIEAYQSVSLIALQDFAPDAAALAEVLANNPVTDDPVRDRAGLQTAWAARAAAMQHVEDDRGWTALGNWRAQCGRR